jgi:dTDP-4-dehydrorhamnose reductase
MRVAVTGTTGRLGAALAGHLSENHEVIPLPRRAFDLEDRISMASVLDRLECDVFLNPAAVTSLEACEDNPQLAMRVNAEAPREIAEWAADRGVQFFQFSTDYVFNGETQGLRDETEVPAPLGVYGRSKLAGEIAVLERPGTCVIRVSWIFGPERPSFVDVIFDSALVGRPLAAVADKFSLPAFTGDLAEWTERLMELKVTGIVHACNSGEPTSWHGMASLVIEEMVAAGALSQPVSIQKQTMAGMTSFRAPRPRFTAMDHRRLTGILGNDPRPWREALSQYIRERCSRL